MKDPIAYSGNPLDRENLRRRSRDWIEARERDPESRYLPYWKLEPLLKLGDVRELAWAKREFFEDLEPAPEPVLLGTRDGVAHFAVDVSVEERREVAFGVEDVASFEDLRAVVAQVPTDDAAIAAHARTPVTHARISSTADTIATHPHASPSIPSVRFTALDEPTIVRTVMITCAASGRAIGSALNGK